MSDFPVSGKRAVVVGGGRSGVAAALLLRERGAEVTLTDVRSTIADVGRLQEAGIALELGYHDSRTLRGADLVVVSPGVPWHLPILDDAREAGVTIVGEIELASRWLQGRLIAITGTKGKSTTTTLVGRMLQAAGMTAGVGGNIGHALTLQVPDSTPSSIHVVEVSSFQLEGIETFHPWIAAILNFSPDHLDRHASVEEYAAAKQRVFANQGPEDWTVVNAGDEGAVALAAASRGQRAWFSLDTPVQEGVTVADGWISYVAPDRQVPLVPLTAVRLFGRHLLADVVAAAAIARLAGAPATAMVRAVEEFTGLEHAMELVAEHRGVRFVNDSKATNVDSARRAIESFEAGVVAIIGGRFKGGDLRDLREPLREHGRAVVAIGEARKRVHDALDDVVTVRDAASMHEAVERAVELALPDGPVLLAPACASFDMFTDYAERGRVFKEEVRRLVGQ